MRRGVHRCLALIVLTAGCASAPPRRPTTAAPVSEGPVARGIGEGTPAERQEMVKAYRDLDAGKLPDAEKRFRKLSQKNPKLLPARTGLGFVRLKQGQTAEAARLFEAVLAEGPLDLDALLGAGAVAAIQGDLASALASYRQAVTAHPNDAPARKRLADARLKFTEQRLAAAREATSASRPDDAVAQYRQALESVPEVAGLRLELAGLLVERGDAAGAAHVLEGDPVGDAQVAARLGAVRMQLKDYAGAVQAYGKSIERDPSDKESRVRLAEAQRAFEFARMPDEYQRIYTAPQITRADMAALIDVKITALARVGALEPKVAVDISGSWAKEHIIKALALDIIGVYPNHTFQPGAVVRRGDLARAVARVLDLLKWPPSSTPVLADVTRNNLYYDAVARVVGAGLMDLTAEGAFEPWRPVSGQQAVAVIEALGRLVGP